jgi:hypothetical protein
VRTTGLFRSTSLNIAVLEQHAFQSFCGSHTSTLLLLFVMPSVALPSPTSGDLPDASLALEGLPDLVDATFDELGTGLRNDLFTSVDLVNAYLKRIEEVNDELHAVIATNPRARAEAAYFDELLKNGIDLCGRINCNVKQC